MIFRFFEPSPEKLNEDFPKGTIRSDVRCPQLPVIADDWIFEFPVLMIVFATIIVRSAVGAGASSLESKLAEEEFTRF